MARTSRFADRTIVNTKKVCSARKGTKRLRAMQMLQTTRETNVAIPKLRKMGADTTFIRFAVQHGFIKLRK